jgi:hypothetical protein
MLTQEESKEKSRLLSNERSRRYRNKNHDKILERSRIYREKNHDKILQHSREYWQRNYAGKEDTPQRRYNSKNKEKISLRNREIKLKNKYGLTVEEYTQMCIKQENKCFICGKIPTILYVDHSHTTNNIRGLICQKCNCALGLFKEDINLLKNLIFYLETISLKEINNIEFDYNFRKRGKVPRKNSSFTLAMYNKMYENQGGRCEICDNFQPTLCVDHDHETNMIRGLICNRCNKSLGLFEDNIEIIRGAIFYLEKN